MSSTITSTLPPLQNSTLSSASTLTSQDNSTLSSTITSTLPPLQNSTLSSASTLTSQDNSTLSSTITSTLPLLQNSTLPPLDNSTLLSTITSSLTSQGNITLQSTIFTKLSSTPSFQSTQFNLNMRLLQTFNNSLNDPFSSYYIQLTNNLTLFVSFFNLPFP